MPTTSKSLRPAHSHQSGSALLIVLAFVVLLTGLILAFFSRSILEQQVSVGSANQVKVDSFAMAAVAATVSDLKLEMEEGSSVVNPVTGNFYVNYYAPTALGGAYSTMAPVVTPGGTTQFGTDILAKGALTNLIKVSLHGQKFYPLASPYNTSQTDPARAAAVSTGQLSDSYGTAATLSADGTSLNSRYITGTRWNKPLFAEKNTNFPLPDWIYVARNGTNPTTFSSAVLLSPSNLASPTTVVGRYAYAIYDEGGLLDVNVAGVPTSIAPSASVSASSSPVYSAYKDSVAMADLTVLKDRGGTQCLTQTQVDTIVGWRNNASAAQSPNSSTSTPLAGTVSGGYTWTGSSGFTSATNYWANVIVNRTGYLRPMSAWSSTPTTLTQSDQFFTSRQQLIQFVDSVLGGSSTAAVEHSLQYLTHFSRGLSQPSYTPSSSRYATLTTANGGNMIGAGTSLGTTGAASTATTVPDNIINPPFLMSRVTTSFTRNDGSIAATGDPLVKKRFALSRLAWLTYLGPIADDSGNYNTATGISTIVTALKSSGYTDAFLRLGGPTNVYKYFGLSWVPDTSTSVDQTSGNATASVSKWVYNHERTTYATTLAQATTATNPIRALNGGNYPVVTTSTPAYALAKTGPNRDPDFFELLKASLTLGSLGKAYNYTASPSSTTVTGYEQTRSNSVDLQVIQIGANIIDQFDTDSYSTKILFTDGSLFGGTVQEVRGVEDLPYFYRIREGKIAITDGPAAATMSICPTTAAAALTAVPTSSGLVAMLQEPEIWNPHAWSTSNPDTNPRPTKFRTVAISTDPNSSSASATALTVVPGWQNFSSHTLAAYSTTTPGPAWKESNTELDFSIPQGDLYLFREPTLLAKAGIPANSSLAIGAGHAISTTLNSTGTALGTGGTYIKSLWPCKMIYDTLGTTADNQQYIGFLAGTGPAVWKSTAIPVDGISASTPTSVSTGVVEACQTYPYSVPNGITYRMQYQDASGNWITYDEKYANFVAASSYNFGTFWTNNNKTFNTYDGATETNIISNEFCQVCEDPRTNRFGLNYQGPDGQRGISTLQFPTRIGVSKVGWASNGNTSGAALTGAVSSLAFATERPDYNVGYSFSTGLNFDLGSAATSAGYYGVNTGPTAAGWVLIPTGGAAANDLIIEPGLMCQNSPAQASNPSSSTTQVISTEDTNGWPVYSALNQFYADPDGVVRRAMGGFVPTSSSNIATPPAASNPSGLPITTATDYSGTTPAPNSENAGRAVMLNRPFHSVADLGYVFCDTPWKNLDMSSPESGSAAMLDVFCLNDTEDPNGLVAGKVNLNTRQSEVIQAILAGAYKDQYNPTSSTISGQLTSSDAGLVATALTNRTSSTTSGQGPLVNVGDLVGRWNSTTAVSTSISNTTSATYLKVTTSLPEDGSKSYLGFSSDGVTATNDLTSALANGSYSTSYSANDQRIDRFREATVRALANSGQTRVWNLMIDIIAQTGRFPATATALPNFYVEGEQRYWVHIAIDRSTGQVIDQQIEVVKE